MPHRHISASTSSSSQLLVYLFLLSGRPRSPTRNRSFSIFAKSIGPCKYVFIPIPSLNPLISRSVFPSLPYSLALAFPFFLYFLLPLPFSSETSRRTSTLLSVPLDPSILSQLRYLTIFQLSLCYSLPNSPIKYDWQPLFWHVPYLILPFQLVMSLFVLSGYMPSSALNTVLLVVLGHPRFFSAAAICTVSNLRVSCSLPILVLHILALVLSHSSGYLSYP